MELKLAMHLLKASRGGIANPRSPRQTNDLPKTRKRYWRKSFWWLMMSICGVLVYNELMWGGKSILSTVVIPDSPNNNWNKTRVAGLPNADDGMDNPAPDDANGIHNETMKNTDVFSLNSDPSDIDPYSLKKGIASFLWASGKHKGSRDISAWNLLEKYTTGVPSSTQEARTETEKPFFYYEHDELSSELVCGLGPGRGMEQDSGYKLLVEKIRILEAPITRDNPKVLCLVYTYSPMRHLNRAQALMWGRHCDGYLAFSNETLPELGIYQLPPNNREREESYNNMWQKSRAIWKHVHDHFLDSFDYFYLSGDDVYLMVNNLRAYLQELEGIPKQARHFGSWLPERSMVSGGPGYVLNRAALHQYVGSGNSSSVWSTCKVDIHRPYEDRYLSECLSNKLGIWGNSTDTRDLLGEQRFHDTDTATLYTFRASSHKSASYFARQAKAWEDQPMPRQTNATAVVGPKHGIEAAAKHSISFHRIYTPTYMARIHAILHQDCPVDSPLGRGMQTHMIS